MSSRSARKSKSVATKSVELVIAVPQVVAHRVTRMATSGPTPSARDRKEFERMVTEKKAAFAEAWQAMAMQTLRANQVFATSLLRSFWSPSLKGKPSAGKLATQMHSAALDVFSKGLSPVHRKAVANAKRLARTKLR